MMYSPWFGPRDPIQDQMKNSKQISRSVKGVSKVVSDRKAQEWLVTALDPFHDDVISCHGLPDERSAPSVVQVHNQTYNLTVPTSAGTGTWDSSILFTGFNSVINPNLPGGGMITVTGSAIHRYTYGSLSAGAAFGALNIWAGAAGSVQSTGAPYTSGDTYTCLGSVKEVDRCRLVGVGIEVYNTTAEVFKQGSLTVAQLPDAACDATTTKYTESAGAWTDHTVQADRAVKQACTVPYLKAVPGSMTWAAADGVYCVPRMTQVPRDIYSYAYVPNDGVTSNRGANSRIPVLYGTDGKTATPEPVGQLQHAGSIFCPQFLPYGPNGFSPIQIYCSGLSNETTLTISFRTIVEYFPVLDSTLLPMAAPSPSFDPEILRLYSHIVSQMNYACKVRDNATGDYFRRVARIIARVLTIGSPFLGEFGPLVGLIGRLGTKMLNQDVASPD